MHCPAVMYAQTLAQSCYYLSCLAVQIRFEVNKSTTTVCESSIFNSIFFSQHAFMATLNMKLTARSKFNSHCSSTDQMLDFSNVRYCKHKISVY